MRRYSFEEIQRFAYTGKSYGWCRSGSVAVLEQENERLKLKLKSIANAAAECLDEREEELGLRRRC